MISLLKGINLALAFALELAALAAFAYWGFNASDSTLVKIVLGVGVTLLAAVLWGFLAAPKSTVRLKGIAYWAFKVVFFGLAVVALVIAGQPTLGVALAVITAINLGLLYLWKQ